MKELHEIKASLRVSQSNEVDGLTHDFTRQVGQPQDELGFGHKNPDGLLGRGLFRLRVATRWIRFGLRNGFLLSGNTDRISSFLGFLVIILDWGFLQSDQKWHQTLSKAYKVIDIKLQSPWLRRRSLGLGFGLCLLGDTRSFGTEARFEPEEQERQGIFIFFSYRVGRFSRTNPLLTGDLSLVLKHSQLLMEMFLSLSRIHKSSNLDCLQQEKKMHKTNHYAKKKWPADGLVTLWESHIGKIFYELWRHRCTNLNPLGNQRINDVYDAKVCQKDDSVNSVNLALSQGQTFKKKFWSLKIKTLRFIELIYLINHKLARMIAPTPVLGIRWERGQQTYSINSSCYLIPRDELVITDVMIERQSLHVLLKPCKKVARERPSSTTPHISNHMMMIIHHRRSYHQCRLEGTWKGPRWRAQQPQSTTNAFECRPIWFRLRQEPRLCRRHWNQNWIQNLFGWFEHWEWQDRKDASDWEGVSKYEMVWFLE